MKEGSSWSTGKIEMGRKEWRDRERERRREGKGRERRVGLADRWITSTVCPQLAIFMRCQVPRKERWICVRFAFLFLKSRLCFC